MGEVNFLPERAFWAHVNNIQTRECLSVEETASRVGVSVEELEERMTFYRFYDADGLPMFEYAAA